METSSDPLKGKIFSIDLSSDGAARLREAVKQKLEDFMGYTDDVLAEYVAVLVCHGKQQDQAKRDLDAFLGNHSGAFVAWLWDHIASNINLYMASSESSQPVDVNEQGKVSSEERVKRSSEKQTKRNVDAETKSKGDNGASVSALTHTEVNERPIKSREARRRRDWNPSDHKPSREAKETPRQQTKYDERADSRAVQTSQFIGKSVTKRPHSPESWTRRERFRHDEGHADKRMSSPTGVHAPRRLLQSAVREAVGPNGPANSKRSESSSKRLRSVVSTTVENSDTSLDAVEGNQRPRALVKSLPAMAVAMKAAAAAAEDAAKVKSGGSVFDRLGKRIDTDLNGLHEAVEEDMLDDGNNIENTMTAAVYQGREYQQRTQVHSRLSRGLTDDVAMMDSESIIPSNPATYNEGYDEVHEDARYTRRFASVSTRRKQFETAESDGVSRLSNFERQPIQDQEPQKPHEESVTVKYRLARHSDEVARENRMQKASSLSEAPSSSRKIVNISVNVNTWKSPHFQSARDTADRETRSSNTDTKILSDHNEMDIDGTLPGNSEMRLQAESGQIASATDANGISGTDYSSDVRKGTSSVSGVNNSVRPEDADSRTLFVSNVHFAATKEAITKHFSRCGEVVKVIMLTDAATGQPKGSAYIEFSCRETAEIALTLNETSFMSRMLKVVQKNASHVEPSITARPPLRRPLPFSAWRPTRAVYGRGLASTYRRGYMPRPFVSRSLQWRRDASSGGTSDNSAPLNEPPSGVNSVPVFGGNPAGPASAQLSRPLTYIRDATKVSNENAGKSQE